MNANTTWLRFLACRCEVPSLELSLDFSRMKFDDDFFTQMEPAMQRAYAAMDELEKGALANPDEQRMVGHYWLRTPTLAPNGDLAADIAQTVQQAKALAQAVHAGTIRPPSRPRFTRLLLVGIGGSALGPMFVHDALGNPRTDKVQVCFLDNTDPDGMARVLAELSGQLAETLCLVISKSGGTPETRNGMLCVMAAYQDAALDFARHAVAITGRGSKLDQQAAAQGWLARFPMWDWVGGRTSQTSVVGLLPAALQGIDIDALLAGAADCDAVTRSHDTRRNPSALLALMWYYATGGKGSKDLVVLPYKDRLVLFSRYLQQLLMESLGKRLNLQGERVDQGLTIYGNKGSTDQHAYVQQLRDGLNNFFVTFIRVLESGGEPVEVEPGVTAGDYLHGLLLGTRQALYENDRESMTLTVRRVDARTIGVLIALFERAVGFYASLVGINAYDQPGVEAGKKAATAVLELQKRIEATLGDQGQTAAEIAAGLEAETVYALLEHLAANGRARLVEGDNPATAKFCK